MVSQGSNYLNSELSHALHKDIANCHFSTGCHGSLILISVEYYGSHYLGDMCKIKDLLMKSVKYDTKL